MAEEKKLKIKTKIKSSEKVTDIIDNALASMSKLSIDKPITGRMDYLLKKRNGIIVIDELTISDSLGKEYISFSRKIKSGAIASLESVEDGKVRVVFQSESEFIKE